MFALLLLVFVAAEAGSPFCPFGIFPSITFRKNTSSFFSFSATAQLSSSSVCSLLPSVLSSYKETTMMWCLNANYRENKHVQRYN